MPDDGGRRVPFHPSARGAGPGVASGTGASVPSTGRVVIDVVTLGETMALLSTPRTGRLRDMSSLDIAIGGAESNVAIAMQRLGYRARWVGRVGDDEFGHLILDRLRAEAVDISRAVVDRSAPTALMIKERRAADVVRVTYYRSGFAGSRLHPQDVADEVVAGARMLHVTGITLALSDTARAAAYRAVAVAKACEIPVSFDLNYRSALWSRESAASVYAEMVGLADVVFAGDDELEILDPGMDAVTIAENLVEAGTAEVVIKRGAEGATRVAEDGVLDAPALAVRAVDPVGAGDAFVAGYLSGSLDGLAPAERLAMGCAMGAYAVTFPGDCESLPTRADLELLDARPGHTLR